MTDTVELLEVPQAKEIYLLAGWRQWADAGSVSSGLPQYLINQTKARKIGAIRPDGFYLFQIPGTHDLVRPVVQFEDGYPVSLETPKNELYYTGDDQLGVVIFIGDEPHLDIERYIASILEAAKTLNAKRIIGFGGVYGELPYDKERMVSCNYSQTWLKEEMAGYAVEFSDYGGGASIGSVLCRRAGEAGMEYVGLYAFAPTYDFSTLDEIDSAIRIETDYTAWLGIMRRVNHMIKWGLDLSDLEEKSLQLIELMEARVDELESNAPEAGVRAYFRKLSEDFSETSYNPLEDVWEDEIKRLFGRMDDDEPEGNDIP